MLFTVVETYAEYSYDKKIWELLEIRADSWSKYKLKRYLPFKQYKKICDLLGISLSDDDKAIVQKIVETYFEEKEVHHGN
jgi:hypothetical protein